MKRYKATDEQIEAVIQKYSSKESVLEILCSGRIRPLTMIERILEKGATAKSLSGQSRGQIIIPECRNGCYLCNDLFSFKMHMKIVERIMENFIKNNPQYFTLKENTKKYAVSYQFVKDFFEFNKSKDFDSLEFIDVLQYIHDPELFEHIAKTFYLPYINDETWEEVKIKYWKKRKVFTAKKKAGVTA